MRWLLDRKRTGPGRRDARGLRGLRDELGIRADRAASKADLYAIDQIEKTWHRATSTQNVELMMSLWAPGSDVHHRARRDARRASSRFAASGGRRPCSSARTTGSPTTPAYKIRITVNGDRGTLYFERHDVDAKTRRVVAVTGADQQVAMIDGTWLITNNVGGKPDADAAPAGAPRGSGEWLAAGRAGDRRRSLSWGDNPLVRAVARPAGQGPHEAARRVHGHRDPGRRGCRSLGSSCSARSNDRDGSGLGALQERAFVYGKLQSAVFDVRLLLAENVAGDFYRLNNPGLTPLGGRAATRVDGAIINALERIGPTTPGRRASASSLRPRMRASSGASA